MSQIFTDAQIAEIGKGHPLQDLMKLINAHTNSLEYAAQNLAFLAELAEHNQEAYRSARMNMVRAAKQKRAQQEEA